MLSGVSTLLRKAKTTATSAIIVVGIISFMTNAPRSKERGVKMPERKDKEKYNMRLSNLSKLLSIKPGTSK